MTAKVLALNVAKPENLQFEDLETRTSMHKRPVDELKVSLRSIEGDVFATSQLHGTVDSVLYIVGLESIRPYAQSLGLADYPTGFIGENILVDKFDEKEISVGDIFQIGEVQVQATSPRIPCNKLNVSTQNRRGRELMVENLRSGVYFRILQAGVIRASDSVVRIQESNAPFALFELYDLLAFKKKWSSEQIERARENGAFAAVLVKKFLS